MTRQRKARRGKRVRTLQQLRALAMTRRAVVVPGAWGGRSQPAAFMVHLSGVLLARLLDQGMYVYEKPLTTTTTEGLSHERN